MSIGLSLDAEGLNTAQAFIDRLSLISRIYWPNIVLDRVAEDWQFQLKELAPKHIGDEITIQSGPDTRIIKMNHPHTRLMDEGSPPHTILPKNKKVLAFYKKSGEYVVTARVKHPGFKGKNFIQRSIGKVVEFARKEFKAIVEDDLQKEISYLKRGRWW